MSEYKIDKGIPIPLSRSGGQKTQDLVMLMEVGDSIFVPDVTSSATASSRLGLSWRAAKYQRQFTCRKVEGGVRVWRVK